MTEHLLYEGDVTVDYLTTLINNIIYTKHVSDITKKGLLTPVHKKDTTSKAFSASKVIKIRFSLLSLASFIASVIKRAILMDDTRLVNPFWNLL
jgi:hypothetical protein